MDSWVVERSYLARSRFAIELTVELRLKLITIIIISIIIKLLLRLLQIETGHRRINKHKWKKRSERRKHCALAVVRRSQKFRPAADPLSGNAGRPKFNQLERRSLPSATDPVWWRSMHAISSYRGNPQTGPITIHCAAKLRAQCNELIKIKPTNKMSKIKHQTIVSRMQC